MLARQLITIAIAAGIMLADYPRLVRSRLWGELWTHAALTLGAVVLLLLPTIGVEIPPLLKWLVMVAEPYGKQLLAWLG